VYSERLDGAADGKQVPYEDEPYVHMKPFQALVQFRIRQFSPRFGKVEVRPLDRIRVPEARVQSVVGYVEQYVRLSC
jgi:hypothetical protein